MLDDLMQGADRDLVKIWQKMNSKRFDNTMLKTKTVSARVLTEGIEVTFAPAGEGGTVAPPLGESIGMAAEIAHGSCTDVPSARK